MLQHIPALVTEEEGAEQSRVEAELGLKWVGAHLMEAPSSTGHQPDTSHVLEAPW